MSKRKSRGGQAPPPVPPPSVAQTSDTPQVLAISAGLLALVAAIFTQMRTHAFVHFDDPIYVTDNPHVRAGLTLDGIRWAMTSLDFNWHPVTWITHMLDVTLFGIEPGAHLLMNAAWHAANTLLLFFVMRRLTGALWRSAMVAALFGVHPMHVESVAWIAERKDVVSAFFFLATLWFYAGWTQRGRRAAYVLSIVAFILGLMSKGMLVTTPFVLLLLDYWPLIRGWTRKLVVEKVPYFAVMIGGVAITYIAQRVVEATKPNAMLPFGTRIGRAIVSYALYVGKLFWPAPLAIPYPYNYGMGAASIVIALVVLIAITVLVIRFRERRYLFTGWFWFTGMLVPVIGLVQIGSQAMADRYTYLPSIGLFIAVVWLVADLIPNRTALAAAGALVVLALTFVAHTQASYWRDSLTLFRHAIDVTTNNETAHTALGSALLEQLDFDGAAREMRMALKITPDDAVARAGLGAALRLQGDNAGAARELSAAIAKNPKDAKAYRQYAAVLLDQKDTKGAIANLEKSLALQDDPETRAALESARGNDDAAIAAYQEAIRRQESASLHNDLATILSRKGRDNEALAEYEAALRLAPDHYDAHMNAGALLSRMSRNADAAAHFNAALRIRPKSTEPHIYLSLIDTQDGKFADAAAELDAALAIDRVATNNELTNATHMPFKDTNAEEYRAFLTSKH